VGGAIIAAVAIPQARATARRQATFRYLERYTSGRMRRIIRRCAEIYDLDPAWARPLIYPDEHPVWPLATHRPAPDPREQGCLRYETASRADRLGIDELFDLHEEVSAVYRRGLLDRAIFEDQIAPQLIVDWRVGHWLINRFRKRADGTLDVDVYQNWQRVYVLMIARNVKHDEVEDSDPDAGDYARLLERRPRFWPDRIHWDGFRPPA
jgi:hypothetical protein